MEMWVVSTQILENYGAHCGTGKFADGEACWKMKGGNDYIVSDLKREQDAVAFVHAYVSKDSGIHFKEFPTKWRTLTEWKAELAALDQDYREFLMDQAETISAIFECAREQVVEINMGVH